MVASSFRRLLQHLNHRTRPSRPHPRRYRPMIEMLEGRLVPVMTNHGGPVLANVRAETVFYGSAWNDGGPNFTLSQTLDSYTQYIVNSPFMDLLTNAGYGVGRGSAIAGPILPVNLSSGVLHDNDVQHLLQQDINNGTLVNPDSNTLYVIYVQPGVEVIDDSNGWTSESNFLAYHSDFSGQDTSKKSLDIHYSITPYQAAPNLFNGSLSSVLDSTTMVTSHEIAESCTDPNNPTGPFTWYDTASKNEICDVVPLSSFTRLDGWVVTDVGNIQEALIDPVLPGWSLVPSGPSQGALTYNGTGTITLTTNAEFGGVTVINDNTGDSVEYNSNDNDITSIQINTGSSTTSVYIEATLPTVPVTIVGGGPNTIELGSGGSMQAILSPVNIENAPSYSAVTLDDSTDPTGRTVTLTSSGVTGLTMEPISFVGSDILSTLTISGGTGGNTFNVSSTPTLEAGGSITLNTGSGNDTTTIFTTIAPVIVNGIDGFDVVNLGNANSVQGITAAVTLSNNGGTSNVNVNDSSDGTGRTAMLTSSALTGLAPGAISFSSIGFLDALTINGGGGGNTFNVNSTPSASQINLNTGSGNDTTTILADSAPLNVNGQNGLDTVNVGTGSVQGIILPLTLSNPGGYSAVTLNDSSDSTSRTVTLSSSAVTGLAPKPISFTGAAFLDPLTIDGGGGGNTFIVASTPTAFGSGIILNTGSGNDTTTIQANTTPLTVNGNNGTDTVNVGISNSVQGIVANVTLSNTLGTSDVNVNDQADPTARTVTLSAGSLTGLARAAINFDALTLFHDLNITGGSGGNTFTVSGTPSAFRINLNTGSGSDTTTVQAISSPLSLNGYLGTDTVKVGNAGSVQGITAALTLDNSFGFSAVTIDDSADPTGHNAGLSSSSLTGLAPSAINFQTLYTFLSNLTINLGSGNDNVTVTGTPGVQSNLLVVNTGAGNDDITVSANTTPLDIVGGTGNDALAVNFSSAPAHNTITFDGGPGTNSLALQGGSLTSLSDTLIGPLASSFSVDDLSGFHTVTVLNTATAQLNPASVGTLTFVLPAGSVSASLEDDSTPNNGVSRIRSQNATFPTTTFLDPINQLTVNYGSGTTLTVSPLDAQFKEALTLSDGGAGGDVVNLAGTLNLGTPAGPQNLVVTAGTVNIDSQINTLLGGTQTYNGSVFFADAITDLTGSNITFTGPVNLGTSTVIVTGNLTLSSSATLVSKLAGASQCGHFAYSDAAFLGSATLSLGLQGGFVPASPQTFDVIQAGGTVAGIFGTFAGLPEGSTVTLGSATLFMTYHGGSGHNATLQFTNPLHLALSVPGSVVAGSNFIFSVQAEDAANNPVSAFNGTVHFSTTDPAGSVPASVLVLGGSGFYLGTLKTVAGGPWTISATAGTLSAVSTPIAVTPAAPARLAFGVQPVNTPTGVTLPVLTVQVLDPYGNVVTTDNSDVVTAGVATGPGAFAAGSTTTATAVNGVASFGNLTLAAPGSYTLSATVLNKLTGPNSNAFSIAPLQVLPASFAGSSSGFSLTFNAPYLVNSLAPVLYGQGAPAPSVIITTDPTHLGNTAAYVAGSLVLNPATNSLTFVATDTANETNNGAPQLPDGTYTVIVRSTAATDGFQALSGGGYLDGLGTGTPGSGDFKTTFTVNAVAQHDAVVWVPATADGPGQPLEAPGANQTGGGYPVYLDSAGGVTSVLVTLNYNPALLTVTGATGANFSLLASSTPGHANLKYSGPALPAGSQIPLGFITTSVPAGTTASPTPYRAKDLLHLSGVAVNAGVPATTMDALHLVAYVGDGDGNGNYSSNDAVLITRVAIQTDSGFAAYPLVDPVIVADTDGSGFIPADAALQANEAGVNMATVTLANPPLPSGVHFQIIGNNVDPTLSLGAMTAEPGGALTVAVTIDDAHPAGSTGLIEGHLALRYDSSRFTVSAADIHLGSVLAAGTGWTIVPTINSGTGEIAIAFWSATPIDNSQGGSLVTIDLHLDVQGAAPRVANAPSSPDPIALVSSVDPSGTPVTTELEDAQGIFTLSFAPSSGVNSCS